MQKKYFRYPDFSMTAKWLRISDQYYGSDMHFFFFYIFATFMVLPFCSSLPEMYWGLTWIRQGTLEIVIEEVLWSIRGSHQTIWSFPLTNDDILWLDHIQWQPPTDRTLYRTRPFTAFWVVSIDHLRRVWHADRGRLLLRTPGPVPFGTCICSTCWDQRQPIPIRHYTSLWHYYRT